MPLKEPGWTITSLSDLTELSDSESPRPTIPHASGGRDEQNVVSRTSSQASGIGDEHNVVLHLKIDDASDSETGFIPLLRIPKAVIPRYALRPYKWLWFLGFIIHGGDDYGTIAGSAGGEPFSIDFMNSQNDLQHNDVYYASPGTCLARRFLSTVVYW